MANAKTRSANKDAAAGDDQSMEEILQSIRKIIAEEGDDAATAEAPETDDIHDSDILELTDAIQEDGSVINVKEDVLSDIDDALSRAAEDVPEPEAEAESEPETALLDMPEPPRREAAPQVAAEEGLVSAVSIAASAEAMRALKNNGNLGQMPFISGETVEGLVMQLLRPLLKEWLDANLPTIVQREVQREVRRITDSLEKDN